MLIQREMMDRIERKYGMKKENNHCLRRPTQGRWIPDGAAAPRATDLLPMVAGINRRKNVSNMKA
ncbi:MAG: hypothetical protein LBQ54_11165 [Planctomycetaceae bacterium]|nr:hypothetical protein [Planctomycetaceae bacterium]